MPMTDELTLSGKRFISSKRAAEEIGYAQDYIGQLARSGSIDAQRVGGLWYVALDSLNAYRSKEESEADQHVSSVSREVPSVTHSVHNEFVSFDGKDYISASRASELTGYNQDYVGQLARSGKILSRQIGKRWYVERSGIMAHKEQKDALLAAVQSQAVGISRDQQRKEHDVRDITPVHTPVLTYIPEPQVDLLPKIPVLSRAQDIFEDTDDERSDSAAAHEVPIRVSRHPVAQRSFMRHPHHRPVKYEKTNNKAILTGAALTVVVVLSFGLSLFDTGAKFASLQGGLRSIVPAVPENTAMLGAASVAFDSYIAFVEDIFVPELVYRASRR